MTKHRLELFTFCDNCYEQGHEINCHGVNDLRVMPNGEWLCADCFDNFGSEVLQGAGVKDWESCRWGDLPNLPKIGFIEELET